MQRIQKEYKSSFKIADFPAFVSEAYEFIDSRGHFTIHGGDNYYKARDLKKTERADLYSGLFQALTVNSTKVVVYPYLDDAFDYLKEPLFAKKGNQWILKGSSEDLAEFFIRQAYEKRDNFSLTMLIKCSFSDINWQAFFRSCFDPMLLSNSSVMCSSSALSHAKRIKERKIVSIILHRQPLEYPVFLIMSHPETSKKLFKIASKESVVTERFHTLYQHLMKA